MNATKTHAVDMTQGAILPQLLRVAAPIMATAVLQMAHNLIDLFWLSRLSVEAVAAAGSANTYIWLSMALWFIGRMGAEIGVSQNMGKGDTATARHYANNAFVIALVLGTVFGAFLLLAHVPLIWFLNLDDPYVVQLTQQYLIVLSLSIPFMYMKSVISGFYTGFGDTRTPMVMNTIGIVLNMVLTPLAMFSLNFGVIGAAIATTVAHVSSFFIFVWILKAKQNTPFGTDFRLFAKPVRVYVRQIFKWGNPIAIESALFTLLTMLVIRMIADHGTEALAANRIGSQLEALSWLVGSAYASAVSTFIGQNWGAKNYPRLREGFRTSVIVMTIWGIIAGGILFLGAYPLTRIFFHEPLEIELSIMYLQIVAMMQLTACLEGVAAGSFRGRGLTKYPTLVSTVCNVLRVGLSFWLGQRLGLAGIWWGLTIGAMVRGLWMLTWYWLHTRKEPQITPQTTTSNHS